MRARIEAAFVYVVLALAMLATVQIVFAVAGVGETEPTLRARIVQLEEQLRQATRSATICSAQLLVATESEATRAAQAKMNEAAKAMGCELGADFNVVPPVCRQK
jgi:hypothetical protein